MTIEGDLVDNYIKNFLKISFDNKSDDLLLKILKTTIYINKFKINLRSLIFDYLTNFPKG